MFGFRPDGKKVKGMGIIEKAEPFFMPMRIDAVNLLTVTTPCAPIDEFIAREKRNGNTYSYMHIMIATIVRLLYLRPKLNRFIMRGTTYQRKGIQVSMDVKKKLDDEGANETLKFYFTGRENLDEVKHIVDDLISKTVSGEEEGKTSGFIKHLTWTPSWVIRWGLAMLRWFDKHGLIPNSVLRASPFHTSCFFTNLKSIRLGYIYHHLYNFGTTSIFIAMGKEKMMPVVENNKELKIAKMLELGISLDERIADGYYMAKSLRMMKEVLANLDTLKESMPDDGTIPTKIKKTKKKSTKKTKSKKSKSRVKVKKFKEPKKLKPVKVKKEHHGMHFKKKEDNVFVAQQENSTNEE